MFIWLVIIYAILFAFLTWRRFDIALAVFFFALPSYLIRFSIGHLPTTLLEIMLWIITIIWVAKNRKSIIHHLSSITRQHKLLSIAIILFLLAATVSIFTSTNLRAALGEWKAFYVEPIIFFFILATTLKQNSGMEPNKDQKIERLKDYGEQKSFNLSIFQSSQIHSIILALTLSGLITSLLAIYQHFTGWMVPYSFWENQNTYRVTAWYGFPNAVGLFLAPIVPLTSYLAILIWRKITSYKLQVTSYKNPSLTTNYLLLITSLVSIAASIAAIFFARSTGALVGLAAGLLFFLFFYGKKSRRIAIALAIIGLFSLSSISSVSGLSGLRQELLFQDRSGQIRLGIWSETIDFLKDNPIWGAGLASYQEKIKPYHTIVNGEGIEIFHHPHNIFLTMYVNTGLLGLAGFILIIIWFFKKSLSLITYHVTWNMEHGTWNKRTLFIASSMVILLTAGLVDSPYIKNDLAMLFWLLPALLITTQKTTA